jgi:hypothetical protein
MAPHARGGWHRQRPCKPDLASNGLKLFDTELAWNLVQGDAGQQAIPEGIQRSWK